MAAEPVADQCVNCFNYSWPQPEDGGAEKVKRCSKCKVVSYCSNQCQVEHWHKVHSVQCKVLAGLKTLPSNSHDPATCPGCIQESIYTRAGRFDDLARTDNPHYGCALAGYRDILPFKVPYLESLAPLPFPLGDVTGQFRTKAENCLAVVQKLFYKLEICGYPLDFIVVAGGPMKGESGMAVFREVVAELRTGVWLAYCDAVPGAMTDRFVWNMVNNFLEDPVIGKAFYGVLRLLDVHNPAPRQPDGFNICDTLLLLVNMAHTSYHLQKTLAGLQTDLCGEVQQLLACSDSLEKKEAKVDEVLGLLSTGLVPFVQVLKVLCDGELQHPCSHCGIPATVSGLFTVYHNRDTAISRGRAFVTYTHFGVTLYSCGKAPCSEEVLDRMVNTDTVLWSEAAMREEKYGKQRCDNCDLVGKKRHRCSKCLSKLYCSEDCQLEDFKVHKKVCREGEVERKKKGEKEEGVRDAEEMKERVIMEGEKVCGTSPDPAFQPVMNKVAEALGKIKV